jgi:L-asparagine transporter-like permease
VFAYAAIEMVGVAAGEMQDARREVPKAVDAVIFRIGVFYCGSILLLCSMLPTSPYVPGISPFVTVFGAMGVSWMEGLVQGVLRAGRRRTIRLRAAGWTPSPPTTSSSPASRRTERTTGC